MSDAVDYITNELRGVDRNDVGAGEWAERIVACLNRNGYVIVHPDAVPENPIREGEWAIGWNGCRRHIFAAAEEPDLPFRIAVRHDDETWSYTEGEPVVIAAAEEPGNATSDRPTPAQIMEFQWPYSWIEQLDRLDHHGYVIVHPDDIPTYRDGPWNQTAIHPRNADWIEGYNACRDVIIAAAEEMTSHRPSTNKETT